MICHAVCLRRRPRRPERPATNSPATAAQGSALSYRQDDARVTTISPLGDVSYSPRDCSFLARRMFIPHQEDVHNSPGGFACPTFVGRLAHVRGTMRPRSWDNAPTFVGQAHPLGDDALTPRRSRCILLAKQLYPLGEADAFSWRSRCIL